MKGDTDVAYSFVSMNELVKIYKASTVTSTVTLTIDDTTNTISGEVNISADEGNLLEVGADGGLYAKATDITGKAETTGVSVAISASNEISATLVGKAVAEENLTDTLATKINGTDEALTWGAIS